MIEKNIKVFLLEDLKNDQLLIKRAVQKMLPNAIFSIAAKRQEFLDKIEWVKPDIILSDYKLPDFSGLEALLYVKEHHPKTPFVFVSGTLNNQELVAQTIIKGASGFLSKDNLSDLPSKLLEIIERTEGQRKAIEKIQLERTQKEVILQKIQFKISQLPASSEKSELMDLIAKVLPSDGNDTPAV